jgi:hypothetical protein
MPTDQKIVLIQNATTGIASVPTPISSESIVEPMLELATPSINIDPNLGLNLMDIEAPQEPGFDWMLFTDYALWVIMLLLILVVLLKFSQRFYQPVALRWQLRRLASRLDDAEVSEEVITFDQAWLLYAWCLKLQKLQQKSSPASKHLTKMTSLAHSELDSLLARVNQLSFSKQPVSRETYMALLHDAERILRASSGWLSFKNRLVALWKTLRTGNS